MDKKYPKHIIDYAIDNKVSLEEAYRHYIMHGKEEKKEEVVPEINIEDEEKFLSELEEKIKNQLSEDVMNDEEWWNKWHKKMDKISKLEQELDIQQRDDDVITKEEMEWVEWELGTVEKLIREGKI